MAGTVKLSLELTEVAVPITQERKMQKETIRFFRDQFFELSSEFVNNWHNLKEEERTFLDKRIKEIRTILGELQPGLNQ